MDVTHTHHHEGQTLRHSHPGGNYAHGYFEHPGDGSRATGGGAFKPGEPIEYMSRATGPTSHKGEWVRGTFKGDGAPGALLVYNAAGDGPVICRIADVRRPVSESTTPLADALAVVDNRQAWAVASEVDGTRPELEALRALAEAVRASLAEFSEGDVRTLAAAADELWRNDYRSATDEHQDAVLGKARGVFGRATA